MAFPSDGSAGITLPQGSDWSMAPESSVSIWIKKLSAEVPSFQLPSFPSNYVLLQQQRSKGSHFDKYLYGHPSGSRFRSANEFLPHLRYLSNDMKSPCECKLCSSGSNRVKLEVVVDLTATESPKRKRPVSANKSLPSQSPGIRIELSDSDDDIPIAVARKLRPPPKVKTEPMDLDSLSHLIDQKHFAGTVDVSDEDMPLAKLNRKRVKQEPIETCQPGNTFVIDDIDDQESLITNNQTARAVERVREGRGSRNLRNDVKHEAVSENEMFVETMIEPEDDHIVSLLMTKTETDDDEDEVSIVSVVKKEKIDGIDGNTRRRLQPHPDRLRLRRSGAVDDEPTQSSSAERRRSSMDSSRFSTGTNAVPIRPRESMDGIVETSNSRSDVLKRFVFKKAEPPTSVGIIERDSVAELKWPNIPPCPISQTRIDSSREFDLPPCHSTYNRYPTKGALITDDARRLMMDLWKQFLEDDEPITADHVLELTDSFDDADEISDVDTDDSDDEEKYLFQFDPDDEPEVSMRFLVSKVELNDIAGSDGSGLVDIASETTTQYAITASGPNDLDRVLTIRGHLDAVSQAVALLSENLVSAAKERNSRGSDCVILRVLFEKVMVPHIIGTGGRKINLIRDRSDAEVNVQSHLKGSSEQLVNIFGTPDALHIATYYLGYIQDHFGKVSVSQKFSPIDGYVVGHWSDCHIPEHGVLPKVTGRILTNVKAVSKDLIRLMVGKNLRVLTEICQRSGSKITMRRNGLLENIFTVTGRWESNNLALFMLEAARKHAFKKKEEMDKEDKDFKIEVQRFAEQQRLSEESLSRMGIWGHVSKIKKEKLKSYKDRYVLLKEVKEFKDKHMLSDEALRVLGLDRVRILETDELPDQRKSLEMAKKSAESGTLRVLVSVLGSNLF
ncbi:hypothetical protein BCR33DRAFT_765630 [Rhizoclosmatium globosum]|uniref:K Homology domain-containing protein n=1 Tax=Rhizoclosmatium globosum TaxID=329046 RepID=A0A1Y2CDS0_9FUNG|nr:hypothetical protein BCR33DRAFT_765630 [Rhizoclosmatium globosum]|eukprot:ORY45208.1 hypothetical protein BCR33DRAFT_765630 [Rhizoclosmatium globosum]